MINSILLVIHKQIFSLKPAYITTWKIFSHISMINLFWMYVKGGRIIQPMFLLKKWITSCTILPLICPFIVLRIERSWLYLFIAFGFYRINIRWRINFFLYHSYLFLSQIFHHTLPLNCKHSMINRKKIINRNIDSLPKDQKQSCSLLVSSVIKIKKNSLSKSLF